jgi:hypothetical protein
VLNGVEHGGGEYQREMQRSVCHGGIGESRESNWANS